MSVGPILTLGLGAFTDGGVKFLPTLGYGTGATPAPSIDYGGAKPRRRRQEVDDDDQDMTELALLALEQFKKLN